MIKLVGLAVIALTLCAQGQLPSNALGEWKVGKAYNLGLQHPIGIDEKQEEMIIGLVIKISQDEVNVCGKQVPIESVEVKHFTKDEFLARYRFTPDRIGFKDGDIIDVDVNPWHTTQACGPFADPGTHLLLSKSHAVVEVANDYFRFVRRRKH